MNKAVAVALAGLLLLNGTLMAQPASEVESDEEQPAREDVGDRIVLRSGRYLQGVRVLSETQIDVTVEVLPGLPPLILPAGQVVSIRYGKPREEDQGADQEPTDQVAGTPDTELVPARKISPEFSRKLSSPIPPAFQEFKERDLIRILESLARELEIPITFSDAVRRKPEKSRRCSLHLDEPPPVDTFLQETLADAAPWVRIDYNFDAIAVSMATE